MITWDQVSILNSNSKCTLPLNLLLSMTLFILLVYLSAWSDVNKIDKGSAVKCTKTCKVLNSF
jgi:hypothetical protein